MDARLILVHALSPLHAGTGLGVGVIDLPIAREKATNIPFLPGSTLKGVFRDSCDDPVLCTRIFGPDMDNAELHAGAANFTDARLLLLPVRSLRGVFAWVTSPLLLRRLKRDGETVQGLPAMPANIPSVDENACLVSDQGSVLPMTLDGQSTVILEDIPLVSRGSEDVSGWGTWLGNRLFPNDPQWQKELLDRLCLISDDTLGFLLEIATEVIARIRLEDEKKTVEQGALWYEEALPAETVLAGLLAASAIKTSNATVKETFSTIETLSKKPLQFGGNATIGRGLCRVVMV